MFNKDFLDTAEGIAHLSKDEHLGKIICAIQLPEHRPGGMVYLDLLESIVSQQISTAAAKSIFNRFCASFADGIPRPELLLERTPEQLRTTGISPQKARYILHIAAYAREHSLENIHWNSLSDDEIIRLLTPIKGVGTWTVQMVLIFSLGRQNVLPVDDLGIRQAFARLYGLDTQARDAGKKMELLAAPWSPWRSLACRYLWRWNDLLKKNGQ